MARYPHPVLKVDVALVGGTGIGHRLANLGGQPLLVPTPYGPLRGILTTLQSDPPSLSAERSEHSRRGQGGGYEQDDQSQQVSEAKPITLLLVERHSAGHKTPPHGVNYKAIAHGLKNLQVKGCLSTAASGCFRPEWPIGTIAVCHDFIDATSRNVTMFEDNVQHQDFTTPFPLAPTLKQAAQEANIEVQPQGTYLCVNGPRYETPAEIQMFDRWGADLVGMTAATEASCLREAGVPYGLLGIVTNKAAGLGDSELHHGEVADVMETCGQTVVDLLLHTARLIANQKVN